MTDGLEATAITARSQGTKGANAGSYIPISSRPSLTKNEKLELTCLLKQVKPVNQEQAQMHKWEKAQEELWQLITRPQGAWIMK